MEGKHYLGKCDGYGSGRKSCKAFMTWSLSDDGRFSAQAEVWNSSETDIINGGQIVAKVAAMFPGDKLAARINSVWARWHLNDMKAGCEHQQAEKWSERPIDPTKPTSAYIKHPDGRSGWNMLVWLPVESGGLLSAPCPTCGYKYGTKWLKEELPADVVAEIKSWVGVPDRVKVG